MSKKASRFPETPWVVVWKGDDFLIVRPHEVNITVGEGVEVNYVFGSGSQVVSGDECSFHETFESALESARGGNRLEAYITIHSEGEMVLTSIGSQW